MRCPSGDWTTPIVIGEESASKFAVIRSPTIATGFASNYAVGNSISYFDSQIVNANPLSAWELSGKSIGHPDGRFTFAYPKAAIDAKGRLHMVWAEPQGGFRPIEALRWPPDPLGALWSAYYDEHSGWSAPVRIYERPGLQWDDQTITSVFRSSNGQLAVSLQAITNGGAAPSDVVVLRQRGELWDVTKPNSVGLVLYTSVAIDVRRVFLASIASNFASRILNSVFFQSSDDDGTTWSVPQLIHNSNRHVALEIKTLQAPNGALHLVWSQGISPTRAVIRHVWSSDGRTWSAPQDLEPPAGFRSLRAAVDQCGALHVVYEDWKGGGTSGHLDHATWKGKWSLPTHLFTSLRAQSSDVRVAADGRVLLVFLAQPASAPETVPMRTYVSTLEPRASSGSQFAVGEIPCC